MEGSRPEALNGWRAGRQEGHFWVEAMLHTVDTTRREVSWRAVHRDACLSSKIAVVNISDLVWHSNVSSGLGVWFSSYTLPLLSPRLGVRPEGGLACSSLDEAPWAGLGRPLRVLGSCGLNDKHKKCWFWGWLLMKGGDNGHDSPQEEGDTLRQEPKLVETTAESVDVH